MADCTVVMAVDGSQHAEYAFDWYKKNFHKPGFSVILLHCPELYVNDFNLSPGRVAELQREAKELADTLKQTWSVRAASAGINVEFKVEYSNKPGHAIVEVADQSAAAFIVTGSRGLGTVRRTLLGSVSDHVLHHAHCPVLVCRQ